MLAVVSGILSPRLIWLSVFMQASLWNLLMRDWERLLVCPIALLAVPRWRFLSVFFKLTTFRDIKTTWQSTKCRNTQVCSLPCKYLSSLFIFNWLLYRSSPPFCLLLTWQMLPAPPSQGLNTWLDKSPRCVNVGPGYILIVLMHRAFGIFYPNLSKIPGLSVYLVFTDPILFFNVVRDVFFFIAELIMLLHLFPHCLSFMLMT